jgi:Tat protein translocase TatB subunit
MRTVTNTRASGQSSAFSEPRGPRKFDINGSELLVLLVVAVFVIGRERMPEYAAKLAKLVRQVRDMADAAKGQLREQMGRSSMRSTGSSTTFVNTILAASSGRL